MTQSTEHPIRLYRRQNGLTLEVLAERVGVTHGQLSRIERGMTPSLATAMRLAEATSISVETLFGGHMADRKIEAA